MPQEDLGYVELEWTCKNCGTRNPGTLKKCKSCGAPMGATGKFELPAQQVLIQDADKLKQAAVGPDITCPFCGTRNSGDAKSCKQCGGDLTGAAARATSGTLGAFDDSKQPDVKCPNCGTMNPATALKCSNCGASLQPPEPKAQPAAQTLASTGGGFNPLWLGGIIAVVLLCAVGAYFIFGRSSQLTGTVESVTWQRSIAILAQVPVNDADWQDQIPSGATVKSCELKPRGFSDTEQPNSTKVCGTPYVLDQGNGTGKVVQDCQYQVSAQYCSFTRLQWSVINTVTTRGTDLQPNWPQYSLAAGQKEGNRAENYRVIFDAGGQKYTYTASDATDYARFQRGSRWALTVNGIGAITGLKPSP